MPLVSCDFAEILWLTLQYVAISYIWLYSPLYVTHSWVSKPCRGTWRSVAENERMLCCQCYSSLWFAAERYGKLDLLVASAVKPPWRTVIEQRISIFSKHTSPPNSQTERRLPFIFLRCPFHTFSVLWFWKSYETGPCKDTSLGRAKLWAPTGGEVVIAIVLEVVTVTTVVTCRYYLFGAWKNSRWLKDGWKYQQGSNSPIFWIPFRFSFQVTTVDLQGTGHTMTSCFRWIQVWHEAQTGPSPGERGVIRTLDSSGQQSKL